MTKKRLKKEKELVKTERSLKCCRFKDGRVKPEPVYGLCPIRHSLVKRMYEEFLRTFNLKRLTLYSLWSDR